MALTTAQIQNAYVAFFNRPADVAGLTYWSTYAGSTADLLNTFAQSAEYKNLYSGLNNTQIVNAVYSNLFGRTPDVAGLTYWVTQLDQGKLAIGNIADAINKGAQGTDAIIIDNKTTAATEFTKALDTTAEIVAYAGVNSTGLAAVKAWLAAVTSDATTLANATSTTALNTITTTVLNNVASNGSTFMLTKGLDNIQGTSGNDTIIGSIANGTTDPELNTLSALDIINGGAGVDTLKIADNVGAAIVLPNVSNVEIIEVQGAKNVDINTSTVSGVTNLNVTKATVTGGKLVDAVAAATTDVDVSVKAGGGTLKVDGGKNVTVKLADVAVVGDAVTIGAGTAGAAKGDVVVELTGKAATAAVAAQGVVNVTGGKTITVTQKAVGDAAAVASSAAGFTVTQGAVNVTGNADTTTVTVKQDAAVTAVGAAAAVAAKAATQEVTFTEAKKGDTVTLDFGDGKLTFTAKKDLTAAEVASAFANLATGAKQGNASATLGIYTDVIDVGTAGGVTNKWSSGAVQTVDATKSKVVFSTTDLVAGTGVQNPTASITPSKTGTVTATAATAVGGVNEIKAVTGVLGVANGVVTIDDSATATIKTITVDGYANNSVIGSGAGNLTTVLETLNLSNSGGTAGNALMTVADTAATLALTLEKVGSSVTNALTGVVANTEAVLDFTAAPTTLNVKSVGNNRVDLDAVATETLNVSGTGTLVIDERGNNKLNGLKTIKVTETAGLTLTRAGTHTDNVTSVDTTGTTGTVTVAIKGAAATYAGGAGVDNVKVYDASTAIAKAIDLGAGNDRLDLSVDLSGAAINALTPTVELKGGDGTDTIALSAAAAISLSGGTSFQDKISGFERLEVGVMSTTTGTVRLDQMDAINYVISKGSTGAAGTKAVATLNLTGASIANGETLSIGGVVAYTAPASGGPQNAAAVLAGLPATITIGGVVYDIDITGGVAAVKLTAQTPSTLALGADQITDITVGATSTAPTTTVDVTVTTAGVLPATLTLDKMLNNATVQFDAAGSVEVKLADASGTADVVNLITNAATGADIGVATVAGVETINITANDTDASKTAGVDNTSTNTLALSANKATTVKVEGAGNLKLTLAGTSTEVTLIDGSTATGKLTVATLAGDTAATTVKGGSAADTLTAAGANDVLIGGAGNDTLKVTTGAAVTLSGGDGIDAFDLSGYKGTVGGAATITDFAKGETIKFVSNAAADFNSAKVTLIAESTFTEYVAEAMKVASVNSTVTHGVAWFQFNNNTFVVQNMAADNSFNDGTDIIVKLTGTVDLSASSFNEVGQGTLLFI